jgi:nucleotide-binding universal stress UspA family protein
LAAIEDLKGSIGGKTFLSSKKRIKQGTHVTSSADISCCRKKGGHPMIKFKRILFPTDFSPAADHALDFAISLALEHEATLVLVHIVEDIGFSSPSMLSSFPLNLEYEDGMEGQAKAELHKAVAAQLKRQLEVQERLGRGKPFVEILRIAKEEGVDLIVIPTRSKPDPKHTHLGSTAEHVVRLTPCPVLVVRNPEDNVIAH